MLGFIAQPTQKSCIKDESRSRHLDLESRYHFNRKPRVLQIQKFLINLDTRIKSRNRSRWNGILRLVGRHTHIFSTTDHCSKHPQQALQYRFPTQNDENRTFYRKWPLDLLTNAQNTLKTAVYTISIIFEDSCENNCSTDCETLYNYLTSSFSQTEQSDMSSKSQRKNRKLMKVSHQ